MVGVQASEPVFQCFDIRWRYKDTTTITDPMGWISWFRLNIVLTMLLTGTLSLKKSYLIFTTVIL